jgi:hypothetical protein
MLALEELHDGGLSLGGQRRNLANLLIGGFSARLATLERFPAAPDQRKPGLP